MMDTNEIVNGGLDMFGVNAFLATTNFNTKTYDKISLNPEQALQLEYLKLKGLGNVNTDGGYQSHTAHLRKMVSEFGLPWDFHTVAEGGDANDPGNCAIYPLEGGGWRVVRYSNPVETGAGWYVNAKGHDTCVIGGPSENSSNAIEYKFMTYTELMAGKFDLEYLIENILVAKQPCIMAGDKKTLKTTVLVDLGISLATGSPFLGHFPVTRPACIGFMSGESGSGVLQETAGRIAQAKGCKFAKNAGIIFSEDLPRFGDTAHETALGKSIRQNGLEVIAIDPAYIAMLTENPGNLFEVGRLLRGMSEVCREEGCGMLLCHHTKKNKVDAFNPPQLCDIAWSGFQEFARQWLLLGRREIYVDGSGLHRLWLSSGGSAGHGGLWGVDVSEGTRATEGGRFWDVTVNTPDEAKQEAKEAKQEAKEKKQAIELETYRQLIMAVASKVASETKNGLKNLTGLDTTRFNRGFDSMVADGTLERSNVVKIGRNYPGWALSTQKTT